MCRWPSKARTEVLCATGRLLRQGLEQELQSGHRDLWRFSRQGNVLSSQSLWLSSQGSVMPLTFIEGADAELSLRELFACVYVCMRVRKREKQRN